MTERFEHIIGLNSGRVINIQTKDLYLLTKDFVKWDSDIGEFCYYDDSYNKIIKFIKRLRSGDLVRIINTNKVGELTEIVEDYQGEEINGFDVSHLFNFGDDLYVVKFPNHKKGIYNEFQIEKYILKEDIFVD